MKKQKQIDLAIAVVALLLVVASPFCQTQVHAAWWNTAFSVVCDDAANDDEGAGQDVKFRFKLAEIWRDNAGK